MNNPFNLGTGESLYRINDELAATVRGRTFVDVGGLWGTVNEKVSLALRCGATRAVMLDEFPSSSEYWRAFCDRCRERGVEGYECEVGDVENPATVARLGRFDVVHCSGVLYHVPNPIRVLEHLALLTRQLLYIGVMTVPSRIANDAGTIELGAGRMVFIPAVDDQERQILAEYFNSKGLQIPALNHPALPWLNEGGGINHDPWWWLWTPESVAAMARSVGLSVETIFEAWQGFSHYLLCRKA